MRFWKITTVWAVLVLTLAACGEDSTNKTKGTGNLVIAFEPLAGGLPLETDNMRYTNAADNLYEVSEIQWFISDLTLIREGGERLLLDESNFAHYIDTDLPGTLRWEITDPIPVGQYEAIAFTFGIRGEKNKPYMFTDPPESDMIWPFSMGGEQGGYHYMKLNGFWTDTEEQRRPFNFHLGVGQIRDGEGAITGFVQNWFEVILPGSEFSMGNNQTVTMTIAMEVSNWFENPDIYDHNVHGPNIMHNQEAMSMGVRNGAEDVFSLLK